MGVLIDTLAQHIRDAAQDGDVTREDWRHALDQVFGSETQNAPMAIVEQIADVLDLRGATTAASHVRSTDPDDLWTSHIGPMIDEIESAADR